MITQASSEHSVSVAVDKSVGHSALAALKRNYEHELVENKIDGVSMCSNFSLLSVIGPMRGMKGTLAKVTRGISAVNANIYAAAQVGRPASLFLIVCMSCSLLCATIAVGAHYTPCWISSPPSHLLVLVRALSRGRLNEVYLWWLRPR